MEPSITKIKDNNTYRTVFRPVVWKKTFAFDVLPTELHLSIFISVFNQLDEQNLFHNKFYFMPLNVSSTCRGMK